jgi:aldose 1-epimerase
MTARIMTYGATVVSLAGPDGFDVLLGFDSLAGYLREQPYMGAIVGRYGNRIAKGRFSLNGKSYSLAVNNGANALHGGLRGFDKRVWKATAKADAVEFTYRSAAGEEGYPGQLDVTVTYTLTAGNELRIDYLAAASEDTVANLTNHAYFNLSGEATILDHVVRIDADRFTPVDAGLIPTGELRGVAGTPFDFRKATAIGARIDARDQQIQFGGGYDHNWALNGGAGTPFDFRKATAIGARIDARDQQIQFGGGYDHNWALNGGAGTLRKVIEAYSPRSGRVLTVATTEPGVQFYTGNFLDGKLTGKGKRQYVRRAGFCFETQHYPDSPNRPSFPSTVVKKGVPLRSTTVWGLSRR